MEAPKCKVCDHHHWSNQPHVFAKGPATKTKALTAAKAKAAAVPAKKPRKAKKRARG